MDSRSNYEFCQAVSHFKSVAQLKESLNRANKSLNYSEKNGKFGIVIFALNLIIPL